MALADWYEVIDKHAAGGIEMINVYHVLRDSGSVTSALVAEAFEDTILTPLLALQDDRILHSEIAVRNLDVETDFAVRAPSPNQGTIATQGLAFFNVAAIQFNRSRNDMKHGQKRWTCGGETEQADGAWTAAFLTALETLRDPLLTDWERDVSPGVAVCRYGILKRVCDIVPPPDPCPRTRLPEIDEEVDFFLPVTAIIRDQVRSQVSRKKLI